MSETETTIQETEEKKCRDHGAADRIFLVVVDDSDEMQQAMRFACRRGIRIRAVRGHHRFSETADRFVGISTRRR